MVFSSLSFLFLFLPALLAVYFLVPRRYREGRNAVLLLFSLGFYGCGGWRLLPLILVSITMNYVFGLLAAPGRRRRKAALVGAVACNLGLLFVFKYLGFVTANLHALLPSVPELTILLPIGISFYTFQAMSYVIDVYRGDAAVERSFLHVALYVVLFPQLVAGPIVRYSTVAEEIRCRREGADDMAEGLQRFLFGLAKKVLLANQMGLIADAAFSQTAPRLSMGLAWLGVIGYTLQIYFDFSGYSDMAIGLGRAFGFHFLENFNYPYVSRSVTEFWRRWHISLSTWFREYLYIPLGGNRCSRAKWMRNLFLVWAATGIWHGASWNFLLWGLYFWALLLLEKFLLAKPLAKAPAAVGHIYTMLLVMVSWAIFAMEDFSRLGSYLRVMFGLGGAPLADSAFGYYFRSYLPVLIVAAIASTPLAATLWRKLPQRAAQALGTLAILAGLALCTAYLVAGTYNPFLYFRF